MRVVDAVAEWFEIIGVQRYFGYAGGAVWPLLDALVEKPDIVGIQAKHESHAVHMADAYYRVTGKVAPVIVTKGPGLMNTVGGVASARHDSVASLVIAGSGSTHFLGRAGMQELYYSGFEDVVALMRPITKGAWLCVRPDQVIDVLNTALKVATSGRPGPVFVGLPYDIQLAEIEGEVEHVRRRSASPGLRASGAHVDQVAEMLAAAEKPVILAGGGVSRSPGASDALRTVAEQLRIPVVTTLPAKGILPEDHELSLGPVGRSGTHAAARATRESDVVLALGARFSDNHTGNWRKGMIYDVPRTKIIQVDVDPFEVGRNYAVELGLLSDAGAFLTDLSSALGSGAADRHADWLAQTQGYRAEWVEEIQDVLTAPQSPIHPGRLCYEVGEALPENAHVLIDVGDVIQYAEPYMTMRAANRWHINSGMAEMGWATQGAPGIIAADPSATAVALTGDGAFLMGPQVIATAIEYSLPVVWIILNNNELGIERKGSYNSYKRTHPWVSFTRQDTGEPYNPDFAALARSFGAEGRRVERTEEMAEAITTAIDSRRPYVLDVPIDVSIPTYFVKGLDRAYPGTWAESYPGYGLMKVKS
jgi:acetolactate synthase-1/2/3 large subunit